MEMDNRPVAFVAMKYDTDHWNDKRYAAISEELENAGFLSLRSDQINTSGPVVDEVCRLLKEAALVVIDSSGDSQSVSYEIGYCHGANRPADKTLLLRSDANIPFNYRHYRHRVYKDIRHLRRLIRDYLKLSEPILDTMYGYAFTFQYSEQAHFGYIYEGAACIFDALQELKFTGKAECYSGERYEFGGRIFTVGMALRIPGRKMTPDYEWWRRVVHLVSDSAKQTQGRIMLHESSCELAEKAAIKAYNIYCGAAEFENGNAIRLIGEVNSENDSSFFSKWIIGTQEEREP